MGNQLELRERSWKPMTLQMSAELRVIFHAVTTETLARANGYGKHLIHARDKKNLLAGKNDFVQMPFVLREAQADLLARLFYRF